MKGVHQSSYSQRINPKTDECNSENPQIRILIPQKSVFVCVGGAPCRSDTHMTGVVTFKRTELFLYTYFMFKNQIIISMLY